MALKKLLVLISILSLTFVAVRGQSDPQQAYIKKYRELAIKEMDRTGVPASIKLAQGILESNSGRSTLAKKAKNHFGMKCGSVWTGKTYYLEDDDYDANGRLIKSCFRVYKSVKDGYVAHSEFLRDPRKRYRYGFLFELDPTDYKAWARGLKKAGYATSPTYAEKLIKLIERHQLNQYDRMTPGSDTTTPDPGDQILTNNRRFRVNGIDVVLADGTQTIRDIALNEQQPTKRLLKYNEKIKAQTDVPKKDSRVFLKGKRNGYRGKDKKYHQVKKGERMFDLSQRYGVKLSKLLNRNRMEKGEEPAVGQRIKLRGWFKSKKKPKLRDVSEEEELLLEEENNNGGFMDNSETIELEEDEPEDFDTLQEEIFEDNQEELNDGGTGNPAPAGPQFHIVVKGETLYGIARRYDTTVDRVKALNKLAVNIISVGQRLRVR